jgi:type I restriction enzyme S subunit
MSPDLLFEQFDVLTEAPGAIEGLRGLVLQLAFRGELVGEHLSDEPARLLLQRIASSRRSAVGERHNSRRDPAKSFPGHAIPFELPSTWEWARFDQIASIASNLVQPKEHPRLPHVAPDNIEKGNGRLLAYRSVEEDGVRSAKHHFYPGQILYSKIRPNLAKAVLIDFEGLCSADMYPIATQIEPAFLLRYMLSSTFLGMAVRNDTRVAMPKINQEELRAIPVPVAPLAQQCRIVAKVDELMAMCDELEAKQKAKRETRERLVASALDKLTSARDLDEFDTHWHRLRDHFDLLFDHPSSIVPLRKAILQFAVRGKLVPQDANDEPTTDALVRIEKKRERAIAARQFRRSQLPEPAAAGIFDIPDSWSWTHLGNAMLNVTDGFHSTPKAIESGVRYITAKHVKPGLIDFESCLFVSNDDFKEIASKTHPNRGDVLVVNIGAGCGLPSIIEVDFEFAFKNVAILNRTDEVDSRFLFNYLLFIRDDIFNQRTKGGAQPFLSLGMIREIPFPFPPLAEQRRIVAKVEELVASIDALETRLAQTCDTAAQLLQAVVADLLNGSAM